jgi:hypothetical protein
MVRFLLRLFLAILAMRVLVGLARAFTRIGAGDPEDRLGPGNGGGARKKDQSAPKPIVDRSSAIDVPFTEEPGDS